MYDAPSRDRLSDCEHQPAVSHEGYFTPLTCNRGRTPGISDNRKIASPRAVRCGVGTAETIAMRADALHLLLRRVVERIVSGVDIVLSTGDTGMLARPWCWHYAFAFR